MKQDTKNALMVVGAVGGVAGIIALVLYFSGTTAATYAPAYGPLVAPTCTDLGTAGRAPGYCPTCGMR